MRKKGLCPADARPLTFDLTLGACLDRPTGVGFCAIWGFQERQDVILESKEGQFVGYRFTLSRQKGNEYEGSWMTSAVSRFNIVSL